jgi:hypothetical protein
MTMGMGGRQAFNKDNDYLECAATPRFLRALRLVEMTKSGEEIFRIIQLKLIQLKLTNINTQ